MHNLHIAGNNTLLDEAIESALDVHEACLVCTAEIVGSGGKCECNFFLDHMSRNLRLFNAECAAEPTAAVSFGHFNVAEPLYILQKSKGLLFYAEHASEVAALVIGDRAIEVGANVGDAQNINDELGEFVNARSKIGNFIAVFDIVCEKWGYSALIAQAQEPVSETMVSYPL